MSIFRSCIIMADDVRGGRGEMVMILEEGKFMAGALAIFANRDRHNDFKVVLQGGGLYRARSLNKREQTLVLKNVPLKFFWSSLELFLDSEPSLMTCCVGRHVNDLGCWAASCWFS